MFTKVLILAISSSIDSFGIGITYGLKKTKLSPISKLILFAISIIVTSFSLILGDFLESILPSGISNFLGSIILIVLGFFVIFSKSNSFDFDNSNNIDPKEAFFLGLALSLDSLCIGIGSSIMGANTLLFPILVATLQYIFLSLGHLLSIHLIKISHLPNKLWSIISGFLLIVIGILKF